MPLVPPHVASLGPHVPGEPVAEAGREHGIEGVAKLVSSESAVACRLPTARRITVGLHADDERCLAVLRKVLGR